MHNVYIGVGSNLKDRFRNIKLALYHLNTIGKIVKKSSLYISSPVENKHQPYFLNCVVKLTTKLLPYKLLKKLKEIEKKLGRKNTKERYQPRTIDLDILLYDKKIIKSKNLTIPHEKLHKRKFVLWPLAEIAPNFVHPVFNKKIGEIKRKLRDKSQKVRRLSE